MCLAGKVAPALTPDARRVAYVDRPDRDKIDQALVIKEVAGGAERRIALPTDDLALRLAFAP